MSVIMIDCLFDSFCSQQLLRSCIKEDGTDKGDTGNSVKAIPCNFMGSGEEQEVKDK